MMIGSLPTQIGNLTKLTHLSLHTNNWDGTIPTEFGQLTKLQELVLHTTSLSGELPTELQSLTKLHRGEFYSSNFSGNFNTILCSNNNNNKFTELVADCALPNPKVQCDIRNCCTECL